MFRVDKFLLPAFVHALQLHQSRAEDREDHRDQDEPDAQAQHGGAPRGAALAGGAGARH